MTAAVLSLRAGTVVQAPTGTQVQPLARLDPVLLVRHDAPIGHGAAERTGHRQAAFSAAILSA